MALAALWVEKIFARLHGIYGSSFANKFANGQHLPDGTDAGIANAKEVWADDLAGFGDMPDAIAYALRNVDSKFPPSSREFVALCRAAPRKQAAALPAPELSPEQIEANIARLDRVTNRPARIDGLNWARKLRAEYLAGVRLLTIQISMASDALGEHWDEGKCTPKQVVA